MKERDGRPPAQSGLFSLLSSFLQLYDLFLGWMATLEAADPMLRYIVYKGIVLWLHSTLFSLSGSFLLALFLAFW